MTEKQSIHDFTYEEKQDALSEAFQMMKEREQMERLEEAQGLFNAISEMGDGKGRHGEDLKTLEWLIEQAERAHLLEKQVASERAHKLTYRKVAQRYQVERNRYRKALEFYADEITYTDKQHTSRGHLVSTGYSNIMSDKGCKARQALEDSP